MPTSRRALDDPTTVQAIVGLLAEVNRTINRLIGSDLSDTSNANSSPWLDNTLVDPGAPYVQECPRTRLTGFHASNSSASTSCCDIGSCEGAPATGEDSEEVDEPEPERWYVVLVGREPGVYQGSDSLTSNVYGIPNSMVRKCRSREEAVSLYNHKLHVAGVVRVTLEREVLNPEYDSLV
ncbi:hypothetical protein NMY22_g2498 [Coprinellus aureogranulatus]|nr:hypothetical protein NMY22_g2498 [Coprinellus aureogranulatus]